MHSRITQQEARKLMDKIDSASVPIAVFSNGCGSYLTVKLNTKSFVDRLAKLPDTFIGIYDINSTVQMLEDDLAECGVK